MTNKTTMELKHDRGAPGFQLNLFGGPEQIVVVPGGAIVHPIRRRMSGQLPRRRKRSAGDEDRQLKLPLSESGGPSTPPDHHH
jgi:hypothetical protein